MASHQPIRKIVTPEIPDKLYFRIGDVAKLCEVPAYVLRFWETEFPHFKPNKGGTGQRLYRRRDVEMALRIKSLLYDQGYTIPGARQVFKNEAKPKDAEAAPAPTPAAVTPFQPAPAAPTDNNGRHQAEALRALRSELQALAAQLSRPVAPPAEAPVKTLRPRLVLEPRPEPRPFAVVTERPRLRLEPRDSADQRDLFAAETADPAE